MTGVQRSWTHHLLSHLMETKVPSIEKDCGKDIRHRFCKMPGRCWPRTCEVLEDESVLFTQGHWLFPRFPACSTSPGGWTSPLVKIYILFLNFLKEKDNSASLMSDFKAYSSHSNQKSQIFALRLWSEIYWSINENQGLPGFTVGFRPLRSRLITMFMSLGALLCTNSTAY